MRTIKKYAFYIMSAYAIIALVLAVIFWGEITLTQKIGVIGAVLLTFHELEECRFPGGFVEAVGKVMGLDIESADQPSLHFNPLVMCFAVTLLPMLFPNAPLFACGLLMLGIFEGIMHIAGIKLTGSKKPYTPGMATGLIIATCSLVGIVVLAQNGIASPFDWLFGLMWLFICLGGMELGIWHTVGLRPKDMPAKFKRAFANIRGRS